MTTAQKVYTPVSMTQEEWIQKYQPQVNHLDPDASWQDENGNGIMYETFGAEKDYVYDQDPLKVWTYMDADDGGTVLTNGCAVINRIGYFVCAVPYAENESIEIQISEPDCENCFNQQDSCECIPDNFLETQMTERFPDLPATQANQLITLAQVNALGEVLTSWDDSNSFGSIINALLNGDEDQISDMDISIWEPHEKEEYTTIVGLIMSQYVTQIGSIQSVLRILNNEIMEG
jgi:hypothetical protein